MKPYRVLSLDGGGMRGLYTATLVKTLATRLSPGDDGDPDIGSAFNLIVGTSTGGILACGLAAGVAISDIISLYKDSGPKIFPNPMPEGKWGKRRWAFKFKGKSPNSAKELKSALEICLGSETVEDMYVRRKVGLCLTSVKMATFKPRVFKTPHNKLKTLDNKYKIVDICMATSAAPLYLPLSYLEAPGQNESDINKDFDVYVDGGLWANNPVLVALTEALSMAEDDQPIEILSIGTCPPPSGESPSKDNLDWGGSDWDFGRKALSVSMDSQSEGCDFMAKILSEQLSMRTNRKVSVLRLDQGPAPADHTKYLVLDRADLDAQRVLSQMGAEDGLTAHSKVLSAKEDSFNWIQDALSDLTFLQRRPTVSNSEEPTTPDSLS